MTQTSTSINKPITNEDVSSTTVAVKATELPHDLTQTTEVQSTGTASLTTQHSAEQSVTQQNMGQFAQALVPLTNPYPDQTPSRILTRQFRVARIAWGPSFTSQYLDFPKVLLDQLSFECALKTFPFFRADLEITTKINTTPYHMGAMLVSWLPCTNRTVTSAFQASGNNAMIMNASTQDSLTMRIPYTSPTMWMPATGSQPSALARVYFTEMVGLKAPPTTSDTVTIQVFAKFVNPQVAGFKIPESSQSSEAEGKEMNMSKTRPNAVSGFLQTIPAAVDSVLTTFDAFTGLLDLDKPASLQSVRMMATSSQRTHYLGKGLDVSTPASLYPQATMTNVDHLMGPVHTGLPISWFTGQPMLHRIFEFTAKDQSMVIPANPTELGREGVGPEQFPDYLYHFTRIAGLWRGSIKYMFVFTTNSFTSCRFRIGLTYGPYEAECAESGDIVSAVVEVKGTTTTAFTVPYLWDNTWREVYEDEAVQQYPSVFVVSLDDPVGESLPSDPLITLSVFRSGGPDFQLAYPAPNTPYVPPPPASGKRRVIEESQCSINGFFSKTFPTMIEGAHYSLEGKHCVAETIGTLNDLMRRYASNEQASVGEGMDDPFLSFHPYVEHFRDLFLFWRGSRRAWGFPLPNTAYRLGISQLGSYAAMPHDSWNVAITNAEVSTIEIPYYSNVPFVPIDSSKFVGGTVVRPPVIFPVVGSVSNFFYKVAMGDDFVMSFLIAPLYPVPPYISFDKGKRKRKI